MDARDFFEEEREFLELQYPGITLSRILSEMENISVESYEEFFKSLRKGIPLEYISNIAYFYRSEFYVNEKVLIPRSETEILVEYASKFAKKLREKTDRVLAVCDIGTGSGAIALSLIQELNFPIQLTATDISEEALVVARKNSTQLSHNFPKDSKINFVKTDRMAGITQTFDLILSNPPYIKFCEDRHKVHGQVEAHEPHLALYIEDDQYDEWFKLLFKQAEASLNEHGLFLMEGHEDHLQHQRDILKGYDFEEIEVIRDYTGRDRFLKGIKICKS